MILSNLELSQAFRLEKASRSKYSLEKIPGGILPKWMDSIERAERVPEGMHECPHCVLPNTLILGDNKPIIEYSSGGRTIGPTGLNKVLRTFVRKYTGKILTIEANGMLPIVTTPEHPILASMSQTVRRRQGNRLANTMLFSDERWFPAENLVPKNAYNDGNFLVVPIVKGTFEETRIDLSPFIKRRKPRHRGYREVFPLDEDTVWLMGLYAAEGSITGEVRFSLESHEQEIRDKINKIAIRLGYSPYTQYADHARSMLVVIPSRDLARAFDFWCGHRAPNMRIPDFVLLHKEKSLVRAFLKGYEEGNSSEATNKLRGNKVYRVSSTTSNLLAQQLQLAYARLGIWASISVKHEKTGDVIMDRKVAVLLKYSVEYPLQPNASKSKVRFFEDRILSPIRTITRQDYEGNVCNLETTDNCYLVSNAIVHNCGRWFKTDIELSMHTKLHYLV